jgi:hypothetical protein
MATKMFVGVTVNDSQLDELYLAVGLVDGVEIVHTTKARRNKARVTPPARGRAVNGAAVPAIKKLEPVKPTAGSNGDPRIVYRRSESGAVILDSAATLKNIGLTAGQLDGMTTRQGTLESSLKRSIAAQRAVAQPAVRRAA